MARCGVPALKKLTLRFCDWGGSSRSMREFIAQHLPGFQHSHPDVEVEQVLKRNSHPVLQGTYGNGRSRAVGVKNLSIKAIQEHLFWLSSSLGRSTGKRVIRTRMHSHRPSIQGKWTVATWPQAGAQKQAQAQ